MNNKINVPFGLLFEEESPLATETIVPIYDEDQQISIIIDDDGQKVPFVEYQGAVGTRTVTAQTVESSDDDNSMLKMLGTSTATKVKEESSDADDFHPALGTKTETFVNAEQSDEDPERFWVNQVLSTKTFTRLAEEDTDSDVE